MKPRRRQVFVLVLLAVLATLLVTPRIAHASIPNIVDEKGTRHTTFATALQNVPDGGSVTLTVINDTPTPTAIDFTLSRNINVTLVPKRASAGFPTLGNINISAGSLTLKSSSGSFFVVNGATRVSGGSLTTSQVGFYNNVYASNNAKLSLTDTSIRDGSYFSKGTDMLATLYLSGRATCDLYGCSIQGNVYVGSGCSIPHLVRGGITMNHVFTTKGKYGLFVEQGGTVGEIRDCTIYGADGSIRFMGKNSTPIEGCTLISGKQITPGTEQSSDWNGARIEKSLEKTLLGMGPGSYYGSDREFDVTWFKTMMPEGYRLSRWTRTKSPLFVDATYPARYLIREDCTLTYDANGGTGDMKKYNKKNMWGDRKVVIASCAFTMEKASFKEWNTKPDGTGTAYKPGAKITFDKQGDITLYAQWAVDKCKVTFESRGGSKVAGVQVDGGKTVPRPTDPTRAHYKFQGWYTDDKCTKEYNFSTKVQQATLTLYAKWGDYDQCHVWDKGTVQKQPTCTEKGVTLYTCKADPNHTHTKTEANIEPLGHDTSGKFEIDKSAYREATCTAPGFAAYKKTCPRCGEVIETSQQATKALGHDWGEWVLNSEGTKETRTCKRDGKHTETRQVKLAPCSHPDKQHVPREESTCSNQGHVEYWTCEKCHEWFLDAQCVHPVVSTAQILLPLKEHKGTELETVYEYPTCSAKGRRGWNVRCEVCDAICKSYMVPLEPTGKHTPVASGQHYNVIAPTCEDPGSYDVQQVCKECGMLMGWVTKEDGKPLGHVPGDPVRENVEEPTCEEDGSHEEVVRCTRCGEDLEYTWVHDEPLGHDWGAWETVEQATEFDEGLAKRVCKNDAKHVEWRAIPTLQHEHSMMHIEAEAASCTSEGHKEYWFCDSCGDWFLDEAGTRPITDVSDIMLPRLAHTPGSPVKEGEVAPTCTEEGHYEECVYCTVCNEQLSRKTVILQELGHDWDEWKTVKQAIGTDSGLERRTCKRDASHTEERVIHAPHTHTLTHVDEVKATCWSEGKKEHWRCIDANCGAVFSDKGQTSVADSDLVIPPLGHKLSTPVHEVVQEATCTGEGISYDVRSCTVCGMDLEYTWHYEEPLGHDYGPWKTTKEATEFEEGEAQRVCKHDSSHVEKRSIPVLAHTHKMLHVPATAATCTKEGNNEYWFCEKCREWFRDEAGTQPITDTSQIVIPRSNTHTAGSPTEEPGTPATCTTEGCHFRCTYCTVCGTLLTCDTVVDQALGHDWGEWKTITPAHGTNAGLERRTCKRDASHVDERVIPAYHTHTLKHVAQVNATCTAEGKRAHWECTDPNCGAQFSDAEGKNSVADSDLVIACSGHTRGAAVREHEIAATCTEKGHYDLSEYCTVCGELLSRKTVTLQALGHAWDEWITVKQALGTDAGLKRRVCRRNGDHVDEQVIPAPHTHKIEHVGKKAATCTEDGMAEHWRCTDTDCGALFSDAQGKNSVATSDLVIPRLGHTWGTAVRENEDSPTCTEDGHHDEVVYCTVCHAELMRERVIDWAYGHDWGTWTLVSLAQGTDAGLERRVCRRDESHVDTRVIKAPHAEHDIQPVAQVNATCTKDGVAAHWKCTNSDCGAQFSDAQGNNSVAESDLVIPRLGHIRGDVVRENEVAPTCTEDGSHDEVVYCTREGCGVELSRVTVADKATGHDWGEWKTVEEATEEEEGVSQRTCSHDGSHVQTRPIPRLPHTHAMYQVTAQAATCTRPGNKAFYICTKCGEWFKDAAGKQPLLDDDEIILPRLAHTAGEMKRENVIRPTCESVGSHDENVYCTNAGCGKLLEHKTVTDPALGHDWDEWTLVKEATEEEPGLKRRTCKNDPTHVDEQVLPAKGYPHYSHEVEFVEQTDPTCWAEGQRAHWRCTDEGCGALFSDLEFTPVSEEELVLPRTAHEPGEMEQEDIHFATCVEGGFMEDAIYCKVCGEELERDTTSILPIGHNPGEPEREYELKATCNEVGWYDEAVYCTACEEELSRRTVTEPCTAHTPSEVVILNVVEPTTTEPGSHDELIYCTVCFQELSWKHVEDPATGDLYYVFEGEGSSWTMGSSDPLRVVFKRSENDEETFARFSGIRVDDRVVDIDLYDAEPGSVVVSVIPEYLQTLSVGEHTLTAVFTDGTASAKFTVVAAPEPTPAQPTVLPRTGDPAAGTLFGATVVLLTVLGVSCVAVALAKQRKRG